jgi:hypothetical protein
MSLPQSIPTSALGAPINVLKTTTTPSHTSDDELMVKLMKFYEEECNLNQALPIICGTSNLSLRSLDWFVTNYSKQYNISYGIKKRNETRIFLVHNSYHMQLKTWSKRQFDPFCRRQRIYFEYAPNEGIETTVGQLNFFKWAVENKVIDYVEKHYDEIVADMNARCKLVGTKADVAIKPKKRELSVAGTKVITPEDVKITLKFDI